jgi:hypothetical protein
VSLKTVFAHGERILSGKNSQSELETAIWAECLRKIPKHDVKHKK